LNYTQLFNELEQASLFDLYRLRVGIGKMLDQPARIKAIKSRLRLDMEITYFDETENRLIPAIVEEFQRTRLLVRNISDGKKWKVPFYMVNIDGVDTDIHADQGQVDRNTLKVGDIVGYRDRQQREQYGQIIRLNPKTVTLHIMKDGAEWRAPYNLLFKVVDGEGGQVQDDGLIEGQVIEIDGEKMIVDQKIETGSIIPKTPPPPKPGKSTQDVQTPPGQKIGRNRPCPCGSGKKFKRCCLSKQ
jgi:hypothetical protein